MQNRNTQRVNTACHAQCAVVMIFFGGFFVLVGIILTAVGNSSDDPFFHDIHRPIRIIGPILLSIGIVFVVTASTLIYHAKKDMNNAFRSGQHTTGVSGPIITGSAPANTYMGAQGPGTQPIIHPTTNVGATPQYGGVATNQPVYPMGPYPAAKAGYPPPAATAGYPPPSAMAGYPPTAAGMTPSAPVGPYRNQSYAPVNKEPEDTHGAPPPSYEEVTGKK